MYKLETFQTENNRTFRMEFREDRRKKAFEENLAKIEEHNKAFEKGKYSFKLSPNHLADLTPQQYLQHYVRLTTSPFDEISDQDYIVANTFSSASYPEALDWRKLGFITEPMNQKSCGSCYAFSIAHSIEGQLFKKLRRVIQLSPQQIVDCSVESGNHGCAGGSLRTALKYLQQCGGLMREKDYPYTATVSKPPSFHIIKVYRMFGKFLSFFAAKHMSI